jgi:hypothetical protein
MLSSYKRTEPRSLEEITALIEAYPEDWRRWCGAPERGGCACNCCVRQPSPNTVQGDPEYARWPNEADALIEAEVAIYNASKGKI